MEELTNASSQAGSIPASSSPRGKSFGSQLAGSSCQAERKQLCLFPLQSSEMGVAAWQGVGEVPVGRLCCLTKEEIVAACMKSRWSCPPHLAEACRQPGPCAKQHPDRTLSTPVFSPAPLVLGEQQLREPGFGSQCEEGLRDWQSAARHSGACQLG